MKQKNKIKTIVFDVGGVLRVGKFSLRKIKEHNSLSIHEYMAKKFKLDIDSWFDSIDSAYVDSIEGKINGKKAVLIISKNLKTSPEKLSKLWIKAYSKLMKKNKKLYRIAHKLRKKGFNIGILSDQWYLSDIALVPKKDIKGFSPLIVSCNVGIRKPNIKIYKLLIKKCKCNADEILFIDNRDWNLKPAQKLGIKTLLFKNNKQIIKDLKKLGVLE